ncbi:MAG TPA: hypothetical protein VGV36_03015, partial [Solirubrobacteraceae bacterium]|nr:hypothetical protein [Solirubrobacteraceae bacterium]
LAPMQTAQLLGGAEGVHGLLRSTRDHLRPGGVLAVALAEAIPFDTPLAEWRAPAAKPLVDGRTERSLPTVEPPAPDVHEADGWAYASLPVAVRPDLDGSGAAWLERRRETVDPLGARTCELDRVRLEAVRLADLYRAAVADGFEALPPRVIAETQDHVASEVALLRREAGDA